MELQKVNEPDYYLVIHKDRYLVVRKGGKALEYDDVIGKEFFIAQGNFLFEPENDFLSSDLTWGFARNLLFSISGYCDKSDYADDDKKYILVCKIEAIL